MIKPGDLVLLKAAGGREYFAAAGGEKLHTDLGIVELKKLEGQEWGSAIESHLGRPFTVLKPRAPDFFKHMKRTGAPMMPKDIGAILSYTGVCPDDVILDAGTGSGVLAVYLGTIAKKVISYEANEQFVKNAIKNVKEAGLENVEVRHGDILREIDTIEGPFDVVTLDMQAASKAAAGAFRVLRPGGFLATYSPFFEQAIEARRAVEQAGFSEINTIIVNEQELDVGKRGTRPSTRVGHTGFITIARKE
jgi:tRNA (adenine57-N1/adenine58-N1)-methyltransferase catalytic subunit